LLSISFKFLILNILIGIQIFIEKNGMQIDAKTIEFALDDYGVQQNNF
jgi:hypothetical protein